MKIYSFIPFFLILQSCFQSPVDSPKENELRVIWDYTHGIVGDAPPVISNNTVYASGGLYLFALDMEDGSQIWQAEINKSSELRGKMLLTKGSQIVANHTSNIRGWDKENGNLLWTFSHNDSLEPRQNGNHSVTKHGYAFSAYDRKFFILDMNGELQLSRQVDKNYGILGIAYANEKLYLAQRNTVHGALTLGRVTVLNAESGDSLWAFDTNNSGFEVAPIIENGILYASTIGNSATEIAVALNAETGEEIWKYESDYIFTRNSALGPRHYYVNTGGSLAALSKENGSLVWRVEWLGTDFNRPVYLEGYVYHVRDGEMLVIDDLIGEVVHREPVPDGGGFFWHVAASSDKILAQTSRQLIAYQPWHLRED